MNRESWFRTRLNIRIKVRLTPWVIYFTEIPLKMMKIAFYFILKGIVSPQHFVYDFSKIMFLMLYY